MSVKGARTSVEEIKKFIKNHCKEIDKIIFTIDWHPYNHMSFKRYGGQYPSHCVQYTPGACIEPKLLKYIQSLEIDYEVSQKGTIEEVEQYGAFDEIEFVTDELGQRYYFDSLVTADANTDFVVCGIAGDYCVKSTIENLIKGDIVPKVFCPGIVSIDGGKIFSDFIKENKLEKIV
jgi:nicotinamidase-related amidase